MHQISQGRAVQRDGFGAGRCAREAERCFGNGKAEVEGREAGAQPVGAEVGKGAGRHHQAVAVAVALHPIHGFGGGGAAQPHGQLQLACSGQNGGGVVKAVVEQRLHGWGGTCRGGFRFDPEISGIAAGLLIAGAAEAAQKHIRYLAKATAVEPQAGVGVARLLRRALGGREGTIAAERVNLAKGIGGGVEPAGVAPRLGARGQLATGEAALADAGEAALRGQVVEAVVGGGFAAQHPGLVRGEGVEAPAQHWRGAIEIGERKVGHVVAAHLVGQGDRANRTPADGSGGRITGCGADPHLNVGLAGRGGVHPGGEQLAIGIEDRGDSGAFDGIEGFDHAVAVGAALAGIGEQNRRAEEQVVGLVFAFQGGIHLGLQQGVFEQVEVALGLDGAEIGVAEEHNAALAADAVVVEVEAVAGRIEVEPIHAGGVGANGILEGDIHPATAVLADAIHQQRRVEVEAAVDRLAAIGSALGVHQIHFAAEAAIHVALEAADRHAGFIQQVGVEAGADQGEDLQTAAIAGHTVGQGEAVGLASGETAFLGHDPNGADAAVAHADLQQGPGRGAGLAGGAAHPLAEAPGAAVEIAAATAVLGQGHAGEGAIAGLQQDLSIAAGGHPSLELAGIEAAVGSAGEGLGAAGVVQVDSADALPAGDGGKQPTPHHGGAFLDHKVGVGEVAARRVHQEGADVGGYAGGGGADGAGGGEAQLVGAALLLALDGAGGHPGQQGGVIAAEALGRGIAELVGQADIAEGSRIGALGHQQIQL